MDTQETDRNLRARIIDDVTDAFRRMEPAGDMEAQARRLGTLEGALLRMAREAMDGYNLDFADVVREIVTYQARYPWKTETVDDTVGVKTTSWTKQERNLRDVLE